MSTNILDLLEQNEGLNLEFKADLRVSEGEEKDRDVKAISAFQNTTGGMVVFGIAEIGAKKEIVGINIPPQVLESNLINKINAKCIPVEMPRFEFIQIEEKHIVVVIVIEVSFLLTLQMVRSI